MSKTDITELSLIFTRFEKTVLIVFGDSLNKVKFHKTLISCVKIIKPHAKYINSFINTTSQTKDEYWAIARFLNNSKVDSVFAGLSYPSRFLKNSSEEDRAGIKEINTILFYFGMLTYLTFRTHDNREILLNKNDDFKNSYAASAITKLQEHCLKADRLVDSFSKENELGKIPRLIFDSYYTSAVEPTMKQRFHPRLLQQGKNSSYFYDIFCSGFLLGVFHDTLLN